MAGREPGEAGPRGRGGQAPDITKDEFATPHFRMYSFKARPRPSYCPAPASAAPPRAARILRKGRPSQDPGFAVSREWARGVGVLPRLKPGERGGAGDAVPAGAAARLDAVPVRASRRESQAARSPPLQVHRPGLP